MTEKMRIPSTILDQIKTDLDLAEDDFDYQQLKNADNPQKIHEALFTASDIGQQLSDEMIQKIYDSIAIPTNVPKQQWSSYAPFCHGTSEENINQIKTEGLKPRLLTGSSQWEESGAASMPDRAYVGINSPAGLEKCIEGMLNASQSIPEGDILFFDLDTLDSEPVADEDCMKIDPFMDAFDSAVQCASFGLKKPVLPNRILKVISFDPYDLVQSADQVCQFLDKGKEGESYMSYNDCMQLFNTVYDNHSMHLYDKKYNRSRCKTSRAGGKKYADLQRWMKY